MAIVLSVALAASLGRAAWKYTTWRNKKIEWDYGTIEQLCGGDSKEERLLDIQFIKPWEYKALKRTPEGKQVWLHWKLSNRTCGNWTLVDQPAGFKIRPFKERFPNGAPSRGAVSCLGDPIDENQAFVLRDEALEDLRRNPAVQLK